MNIKFPVTDKPLNINFPVTDKPFHEIMKKSKLELALDKCNHTMELVRTIVPILVLIIQVIILFKI